MITIFSDFLKFSTISPNIRQISEIFGVFPNIRRYFPNFRRYFPNFRRKNWGVVLKINVIIQNFAKISSVLYKNANF
jgi:hypothetical protein